MVLPEDVGHSTSRPVCLGDWLEHASRQGPIGYLLINDSGGGASQLGSRLIEGLRVCGVPLPVANWVDDELRQRFSPLALT